jgi:pilus assembly protein Flp/PilA
MNKIVAFLKDESGASAAEYAIILAIIGVGIVLALGGLKDAISDAISNAVTALQ